jgi:hypothetical protein
MKRNSDPEYQPWFIVPVKPGLDENCRRWNLALIAALAFIVMGVFFMTMTPEPSASAVNGHKPPVKVQPSRHYPT